MSKRRKKLTEPDIGGWRFWETIGLDESDRGCVLAVHGYCDGLLGDVLWAKLHAESGETDSLIAWLLKDGPQPPLQSFYVKLVVARVLLAIDSHTFQAMVKLNELRNHFAHHPGSVTLNMERAHSIFDLLSPEQKKNSERFPKAVRVWARMTKRRTPARNLFMCAAYLLSGELCNAYTKIMSAASGARVMAAIKKAQSDAANSQAAHK